MHMMVMGPCGDWIVVAMVLSKRGEFDVGWDCDD